MQSYSNKKINRFIIKKIGVNAPLSFKKVDVDGKMPMPNSPDDIAYYDFLKLPGLGGKVGEYGNAIFSGHVDSGIEPCKDGTVDPPCKAVLWDLDILLPDDEIEINFKGNKFFYKVVFNRKINPLSNAWNKTFLISKQEMITVFTCAGEFDESKQDYKSRQVVRAIKIRK